MTTPMTMTDKQNITIVLIDDQAIVRAAFRSLLSQSPRFTIVGDAGDARAGIELVGKLRPDIVILDITMPGLSGLDAVVPLKKASPGTKVLMASQHEGQRFVQQALQAGADGYLSKDSEPAELALAIESIQRGDSYLSPKVANGVMARALRGDAVTVNDASALAVLTPREREVFQLLAIGKANKEVAALLDLSLGTVKKHRENLQRKLDCHSAAELARLAIREGLLNV
jgi:DNA-binding NarL/FixJ family response regulator